MAGSEKLHLSDSLPDECLARAGTAQGYDEAWFSTVARLLA